jgi:hypothetical protein
METPNASEATCAFSPEVSKSPRALLNDLPAGSFPNISNTNPSIAGREEPSDTTIPRRHAGKHEQNSAIAKLSKRHNSRTAGGF